MKKNLLVTLLSVSALSLLAGCGDKKEVVATEEVTTVETTPVATEEVTTMEEAPVAEEAK